MKQVIALMVAGVMAVLLTACGQQQPKQPEVKPETAAQPAQQQPAVEKSAEVQQQQPAAQQ